MTAAASRVDAVVVGAGFAGLYTMYRFRRLGLRVQAFDVFNNYPTVQRNIADNYYEDVAVNRIGSYLMFSVVYKFTSFPGKKDEGDEEE